MEFDKDTFIVEDENGREITATTITRMQIEGTDLEYLIYYIDDENDTRDVPDEEKQVKILAAKISKNEIGEEVLTNIENNEEKQAVYEAFTASYNNAMQA